MFNPMTLACVRGGKMAEMMVNAPLAIPELPAPAMARPMINIDDD
jgi:hypothetical protein